MYPVLKIMHMLNFLDTFSMGITGSHRILWIFRVLTHFLNITKRSARHFPVMISAQGLNFNPTLVISC